MNDRLWTMKVVVEKVRRFICVVKTKFPCFENFPFHDQKAALSVYPEHICRLLSGTISEEALITRYFGSMETC